MKTRIMFPGSWVYHGKGCRYLRRLPMENRIYVDAEKAERRGCRACKCCGTARFRLARERQALDSFVAGKDMVYKPVGDAAYVKTEISCWKICYIPKDAAYEIYHRNKSAVPINFDHPELEHYHRQKDKQDAATMLECFRYIRSHDAFRKLEAASGRGLSKSNISSISPKYREKIQKQKHRQERRRLKKIFATLEQEHPEYVALSRC